MIYQKEADVSCTKVDEETILIHNRRGEVHVLNETGTVVWENVEKSLDEISIILAESFEIDIETARKDTIELIGVLLETEVITQCAESI